MRGLSTSAFVSRRLGMDAAADTLEKLVNEYSKIFTCQRRGACWTAPVAVPEQSMPANTLAQRQQNLVACPKPDAVN